RPQLLLGGDQRGRPYYREALFENSAGGSQEPLCNGNVEPRQAHRDQADLASTHGAAYATRASANEASLARVIAAARLLGSTSGNAAFIGTESQARRNTRSRASALARYSPHPRAAKSAGQPTAANQAAVFSRASSSCASACWTKTPKPTSSPCSEAWLPGRIVSALCTE